MPKLLKKINEKIHYEYTKFIQRYYTLLGNKIECNVCHLKVKQFDSDNWHLYCNCPNCGSNVRQRLLIAAFTYLDEFNYSKIIENKNILHFAPEQSITNLIKPIAKSYTTADILTTGYTYKNIDIIADISNMPDIKDASFDCVIACDVLEHVPNHLRAISEVYRILTKGGYCIFTVPQKDNLLKTLEDSLITSPEEREKQFGQADHLRIYGADFTTMLEHVGFIITAVDETFFDKKLIDNHILFPPVLSQHPLATNYRKVYFGMK